MLLRYLCERAFRSRVNPAGSGSGRDVVEIPNELSAGRILPAPLDDVNAVFTRSLINLISVLSVPMSAKRPNFSSEPVERCACGLRRVPQRNVRIGNIANVL